MKTKGYAKGGAKMMKAMGGRMMAKGMAKGGAKKTKAMTVTQLRAMAKKKGIRRHIILKSTESGHAYHTEKSSRNTPDRIEIKKFDPLLKKHVTYKEEK